MSDVDRGRAPDLPGAEAPAAEGRGAFGGFIGPRTLLGLVRSAAPYLFDGAAAAFATPPSSRGATLADEAASPLGWWAIVRRAADGGAPPAAAQPTPAQWTDYFALCVAAHFSSAATYVPTDVDTKIRDRLWFTPRPAAEIERLRRFVDALQGWDLRPNSRRYVEVDGEVVSGHDGERLSILAGGTLGLFVAGDVEGAEAFAAQIDAELAREARLFDVLAARKGAERDLMLLSAILTHNVGDVDQGFSARGGSSVGAREKDAFGRLAHERFERYGGAFGRAAAVYRACMATEGHRHYPLRDARCLRKDPSFLLPIGPFFDAWGATVARSPLLSADDRASVVDALVEGIRKVKGQFGYQRALAGFAAAYPGGLEARDLEPRLRASVRKDLKDAGLRRELAVPEPSFASSLAKRAKAALAAAP